MSKRNKKRAPDKAAPVEQKKDRRALYRNVLRLLILVALTLAVYLVYNVFVDIYFYPIMISYTAITTVSVFAYVIYNRGFSRRGVTPEMLPSTMTQEEKNEFIEDGKRRLLRSRPLLMVVVAFSFTLIMDVLSLIVFPFFGGLFGS